ncbi:MAG: putative Ig domain-containing protein, partial [Candidatus Zixiibacteriota bacterium]
NRSVSEGINLNFNISATDPDGTIPSFTTTTLPSGATFINNGNGTGTFNWTPTFTQAGVYNVTFRASDGTLVDTEIVQITVNDAGNQRPVLGAIGARSTTEGINVAFGMTAADPDGTTPIINAVSVPAGASFVYNGNGTANFNWTPSFVQAGIYNVLFYATDGVLSDSELVQITVVEAGNQAPILAIIGAKSVSEGTNLNFIVSANDPDGTIPNFTSSTLPSGATFVNNGNGTGTFNWTPNFTQSGLYSITFRASDGSLVDTEVVQITVNEGGNQAPVLATIGPKNVTEGNNLNFNTVGSDADGTTTIMSAGNLPSGATFINNGNGTGTFNWTLNFTQSGTYNVVFRASDGVLVDTEIVAISVNEAGNQAPVLATIGSKNVNENVNLNFAVSAIDPDGTNPSLNTSTLPSGATFIDNGNGTGSFNWTPNFTQSGTYNITFRALDGVARDTEIVTITVNEAGNQAPVLAPIGARSVLEGANLNLNISASDPDGTIPSFTTSALPSGATFVNNGNGTGTFNWTPTFVQAGSFSVTFRALDGVLSDTEVIVITVNEAGNQ